MKKFPRSAMFTAFVGMGLMAFAQSPGQQRSPSPQSQQADPDEPGPQAQGESVTVTGCLVKGSGPTEYAITDSKSGEKVSFEAPDQLQRFLNQIVQLKGTVMNRGGAKAFRPEALKPIAPSCETTQ